MNDLLLFAHSLLRWAVLFLFIVVIARSYTGYRSGRPYDDKDRKLNFRLILSLHLQALVGVILYFTSDMMKNIFADFGASMKNSEQRFWSVEHATVMLIAIVLVQVISIRIKKQSDDATKFRMAFVYYTIALVLILMMIPWGIWNTERPLFRM